MSDLKVLYRADFTSPSGYSRAARAHARALIEAGVDVLCEDHKHDISVVPLDDFWKRELPLRVARQEHAPIKIWHETPEYYTPSPAHKNVAMVAWETDEIPNTDTPTPRHNWVKQLNKMQAVWTFSHYAKKALVNSGVTVPITVIPHPIEPKVYHPSEATQELYDQQRRVIGDDWFTFLGVFQWIPRKNPVALLSAFFTEFKPEEKVALVLKTHYHKVGDTALVKKQIQSVKKSFRLPHRHPRILLVPGVMSDDEMANLYRSCDVMVNASRGEGFCLPAAEALACGLPVIAPKGSAFSDYLTEQHGYPVKCRLEPVFGMQHAPWYFSTQNWHNVDIMHLRGRMREAFENGVGLADRAKQAPKAVARFAPDAVGRQMVKALQELLARARRPIAQAPAVARPPAAGPVSGL
jgi:glycosyltransferase involved in cell wall biosynthesis